MGIHLVMCGCGHTATMSTGAILSSFGVSTAEELGDQCFPVGYHLVELSKRNVLNLLGCTHRPRLLKVGSVFCRSLDGDGERGRRLYALWFSDGQRMGMWLGGAYLTRYGTISTVCSPP